MKQRKPSAQALRLLAALLSRPTEWRHGYSLSKEAGIAPGTLYPLLMRLTDEGLLETEWQVAIRPGLPPRHAYRLTQAGLVFASGWVTLRPAQRGGLAPA